MSFKRCISLMLIIFCTFTAAASPYSDIEAGYKYDKQIGILHNLGILDGIYDDINFEPSKLVKRSEFAGMAAKLLSIEVAVGVALRFTDVNSADKYAAAIAALTEVGVISGFGNNIFRPNDDITVTEAAAMLVRALGYTAHAESKGSFPSGYLMQAQALGLMSALSSFNELTRENAAQMLYNSLEVDIMNLTTVSAGSGYEYSINRGVNVLSYYHDCYTGKGIINANSYSTLTSPESSVVPGQVMIGNNIFYDGQSGASDYLGFNVKYYYIQDEADLIGTIIYVDTSSNNMTEIQYDRIKGYTNNIFYYYRGKDKTNEANLRISRTVDVIWNGKAYPDYKTKELEIEDGFIQFIDQNGDSTYDVINVTAYETAIVNSTNTKNKVIYFKYPEGTKLDLYDLEENFYSIKDKNSKNIPINTILENDILTICKSKDDKLINIYISTDRKDGVITEITEDDIDLDYIPFKVTPSFYDYINSLGVGYDGKFLLDFKGRVSGVYNRDSNAVMYGYYCNATQSKDVDRSVLVKIFTEKGQMEILPLADKLVVDGSDMRSSSFYDDSRFIKTSPGGVKYPNMQLIKFKVREDGSLNYIITKDAYSLPNFLEDLAFDNISLDDVKYKAGAKQFVKKAFMSDTSLLFKVPMAPANDPAHANSFEDRAFSLNRVTLADNTAYQNIDGYDSDDGGEIKVVVYRELYSGSEEYGGSDIPGEARRCVFVDKITNVVDEDGLNTNKAYFLENTTRPSYVALNDKILKKPVYNQSGIQLAGQYKNLEQGDIIQYSLNSDNKISGIKVAFDVSRVDKGRFVVSTGDDISFEYGKVYSKGKNGVKLSVTPIDGPDYINPDFNFDSSHLNSWQLMNIPVSVYDRERKEVYSGTINDITTYKEEQANACMLFLRVKFYESREAFIIK